MGAPVGDPEEDLKHAHELLSRMSPEELLKATHALEQIVEDGPLFQEKLRSDIAGAEASGWVSMEDVLADHGLTMNDLESHKEVVSTRNEAA